jgi:hypothetical protein
MARSVKGIMIVALAVAPAACHPPGTVMGSLLAPCPANAAPSDTAQLHACIAKLEFDTLTAAGDEQRLLVRNAGPGAACHDDSGDTCRHGPLAKIEPVIKAHKRNNAQLDEGRIIARLYLRAGEDESYPKLGLSPSDTTYWWVQRTSATTAVSRFVRLAGDSAVVSEQEEIAIESHPSGSFKQALARFIWYEADEKTQGPCGSGCCRGSP